MPGNALAKYEDACRAIAAAKSVAEVKDVRKTADVLRAYAKQAKDLRLEIDAVELRLRAERRIGEMIFTQKKTVGLNRGAKGSKVTGSRRVPVKDDLPKLIDVGIDKHLADRARRWARIENFEKALADWRKRMSVGQERVTLNLLSQFEEDEKFRRRGLWEKELESPDENRSGRDLIVDDFADDDAQLPKHSDCDMYEQMLRENWFASSLPEKYNSAAKIASDMIWRVMVLAGVISVPGATKDYFISRLWDIANRTEEKISKLEAARRQKHEEASARTAGRVTDA